MDRNKKSRLNNAIYSSISYFIYQVINMICGFVLPRMILETYGSAYNGVISSVTQCFAFFSVFQAGIQGSTRVVLYETFASNDHARLSSVMSANIRYYRKIAYILLAYIVLMAVLMPKIIHGGISGQVLVLLILIIGGTSFVQYYFGYMYKALLAADQSVYVLNALETLSQILSLIFAWMVIHFGGSVIWLKLFCGFAYIANPVILHIYVSNKYKLDRKAKPDDSGLKGRWDVLANSIANSVQENVDIVCLTIFITPDEISVYAVYHLVTSGLYRMIQVFSAGLEPAFGDMWAKGENRSFVHNFNIFEFAIYFLTGILSACMLVLILPFIALYTGNVGDVNYIRPSFAFICMLAFGAQCIRIPYITLVQAAGRYKETKTGSFIEAGLNIILTFLLVHKYGISGAVFATFIANLFRSVQYGYYVSGNIVAENFSLIIKRILWMCLTAGFAVMISSGITGRFWIRNWMEWIMAGSVCAVVTVLVWILSAMAFYRKDFCAFALIIKKFIFRKRGTGR